MAKVVVLTPYAHHIDDLRNRTDTDVKTHHFLTEHISVVEEINVRHSVVHVGTNSFHVNENVTEIFHQMWN